MSEGIPIGFSKESGKPIMFNGETHLLTFGGTGSGKTTQALIPAALTYRHSMIIFDTMGEITATTAHWRRKYGKVFVVNPLGMFPHELRDFPPSGYNPIWRHWLNPLMNTFGTRAARVTASCVTMGDGRDKYWFHSSRQLGQGIVMMVAKHGSAQSVHLAEVARIVNDDVFEYAAWACRHTNDIYIRQKLGRFAMRGARDVRSLSEIVETLRTEMGFLADEAIAECVKRRDFTFGQCKREVTTIYIMLPYEVLDVLGKFNSLMLGSAFGELFREEGNA